MFIIIPLSELQIGMYVERVVKQTGNVTVKSRGLVKTQRLLDILQNKPIQEIEINLEKSDKKFAALFSPKPKKAAALQTKDKKPTLDEPKELDHNSIQKATSVFNQAKSIHESFVKKLRSGANPDFDQVNTLSQDIIDSVFENSDSMACLVMMKGANDYLVEHAINCSVLLAIFAKFKGFPESEIEDITQAGLLMDIGMASLPADLLKKEQDLSEADWLVVKSHVDIGVELVERYADAPPIVFDVIQNHHERADGTGYPKGKTSDELSVYSQMATIVDTYDAMLSNRFHKESDIATNALKELFNNPGLDKSLVVDFTNAIGIHPVGSLVLLSNDMIAMIIKRNNADPLKPVVIAFYNVIGSVATDIQKIDLADANISIKHGIRPEEFSINLPKFFKRAFSPVT